jgi:DNA processing protein
LSVADVLEELGLVAPTAEAAPVARAPAAVWPSDLSDVQRSLCESIGAAPTHIDTLVNVTGLDSGDVLAALTELELRGLVVQRPGMMFEFA